MSSLKCWEKAKREGSCFVCVCLWVVLLKVEILPRNLTTFFGCGMMIGKCIHPMQMWGYDCCQNSVEMFKSKGNRLGFCWYDKILQWFIWETQHCLQPFHHPKWLDGNKLDPGNLMDATAEALSYVISVKISLLAHAWMTRHLHPQSYHHHTSTCLCSIDGASPQSE